MSTGSAIILVEGTEESDIALFLSMEGWLKKAYSSAEYSTTVLTTIRMKENREDIVVTFLCALGFPTEGSYRKGDVRVRLFTPRRNTKVARDIPYPDIASYLTSLNYTVTLQETEW